MGTCECGHDVRLHSYEGEWLVCRYCRCTRDAGAMMVTMVELTGMRAFLDGLRGGRDHG